MCSRETFNINLPAAHYDTNHIDRDTKIEDCDANASWKQNKTKPLITARRQFIRSHVSFNYAFFLTLCAIIGHFATFEGWPLDPPNAECFVDEPRISVFNSSNCFKMIWTASSEFGTYRLCERRRFRRDCASAQSRQNLRCSLIQAVSKEEPSDRKPDPWLLWMAGHAQLNFFLTECSKTQIRLTGLISLNNYI